MRKQDDRQRVIEATSAWSLGGAGLILLSTLVWGSSAAMHWALVTFALQVVLNGILAVLRADLAPWKAASVQLFFAAATTGLCLLLLSLFPEQSYANVWRAYASGTGLAVLLGLTHLKWQVRPRWDPLLTRKFLSFSVPVFLGNSLAALAVLADRLMLESFLGMESVGIYSTAYRIAVVVAVPLSGLHLALSPLIYRFHEKESTPQDLVRSFHMAWGLLLAVCCAIQFLSPQIWHLLYPSELQDGAKICGALALSAIISRLFIFFPGMEIRGATRGIFYSQGAGLIVQVTVGMLLIPTGGLIASAGATLSGGLTLWALHVFQSQRFYRVEFAKVRVLCTLASVIGLLFWDSVRGFEEPLRAWAFGGVGLATLALFRPWKL